MPQVQLANFKLNYEVVGRAGTPVVLIMGLTVPGRSWRSVLPHLQTNHRVAYFDHRGVGGSEAPRGPYSMAQMAGDVVKVWQAHVMSCASVQGAAPAAGTLLAISESGLEVACGEGVLCLTQLQKPGGKRQSSAEFVHSFKGEVGDVFKS